MFLQRGNLVWSNWKQNLLIYLKKAMKGNIKYSLLFKCYYNIIFYVEN